ncbi:MAG: hypothetical protein NXI04_16375, partial [Planctomycetaceae bacterium]|nr:hypothetical protein [Planctomycetaceae bacterium]
LSQTFKSFTDFHQSEAAKSTRPQETQRVLRHVLIRSLDVSIFGVRMGRYSAHVFFSSYQTPSMT